MRSVTCAVLGGLLAVIALAYPVGFGPGVRRSFVPADHARLPRCYSLTYSHSVSTPGLPTTLRLTGARDHDFVDSTYVAAGEPDATAGGVRWRMMGADSIDVTWYHSPVLRLPANGDVVIGRGMPTGVASLAALIVYPVEDFTVRATRIPCRTAVGATPRLVEHEADP